MKRLFFLAATVIAAFSCSNDVKGGSDWMSESPLTAFSVQVGTTDYAGVIDPYRQCVEIGSIENPAEITGVKYALRSETASIMPDPESFVGKWSKSQTVVVTDKGRETAYDIVFILYDETPQRPGGSDTPAEPDPDIVFFDDFDEGETPNEDVWKLCAKGGSAWNQYFDEAAGYRNVKIEDGALVLTADKDGGVYRNGGIRTKGGFGLNTKVEIRAKFTKVGGGFPAIWQMPINGMTWPKSGEIDIMEWVQGSPNNLYHTIHTYGGPSQNDKSSSRTSAMANTNEYHVYAVKRTAKAVTFYVDDRELWSYTNQHLEGEDGLYQYPFTEYDYDIILNYSLGGYLNGALTWPGVINDAALPATMHVDWVRVTKVPEEE